MEFKSIIHHLHFNDNLRINSNKRLYKLTPFLDHLAKKFLNLGVVEEHLSVVESMIPYFGRHYSKQFIEGKPIRFDYKNGALCFSTEYKLAFDVYIGKNSAHDQDNYSGVEGELVKNLLKASELQNKGYKVYFDNYFTS